MPERNDSAPSDDHGARGPRRALRARAPRTRSVLLATGLLVVGVSSVGIAATGSNLREGVRNGTTSKETEIVGNLGSSTGLKGGYVTRQSNLSSSGGGAIYGCRTQAGGSSAKPAPQNPCVRANNLSKGLAFEFNTNLGETVGSISAGNGGDTKRPFVTNATGVAVGLNADRVDGAHLSDIQTDAQNRVNAAKTRWALINENGEIESQSGGFTKVNCYVANDNCYLDIGEDASKHGLTATVSVANTDGSSILSGEAGVAQCFAATVACAPGGTDTGNGGNNGVIVVAPRESDGSDFEVGDATNNTPGPPAPGRAARFYVTVSG